MRRPMRPSRANKPFGNNALHSTTDNSEAKMAQIRCKLAKRGRMT
jgi:hypothetical protein